MNVRVSLHPGPPAAPAAPAAASARSDAPPFFLPGATYVPDFLDAAEHDALLAAIDAQPWRTDLRRRVQHHGYRYDYQARRLGRDSYLGALPPFLVPLAARLAPRFDRVPDQVTVNEYLPGQGIAAHIDCVPCFGGVVAAVSLGSAVEMAFTHASGAAVHHRLAPRSLLVLAGPARYAWSHAIRPRKSDTGIPRTRRLSITFRTVLLDRR